MTTADEPNTNTIAKAEVPGLTKAQNPIQIVVLIAVSLITVWTLYIVAGELLFRPATWHVTLT